MKILPGEKVTPPRGYMEFLKNNKKLVLQDWFWNLTPRPQPTIKDVKRVMYIMQTCFDYKPDTFGDNWRIVEWGTAGEGDCEDFALGCRDYCKYRGFASQLLLCTRRKPNAQGHCALLVGDWVLDCNFINPVKLQNYYEMHVLHAISGKPFLSHWHAVNVKETTNGK